MKKAQHEIEDFIDDRWMTHSEGQLSVDVSETPTHIIVRSAIAGITAENLDIALSEDALTIRGERHHVSEQKNEHTHIQECHWGTFSRSIILPTHVDPNSVEATLKKGILTITIKKAEMDQKVSVLDLDDLE